MKSFRNKFAAVTLAIGSVVSFSSCSSEPMDEQGNDDVSLVAEFPHGEAGPVNALMAVHYQQSPNNFIGKFVEIAADTVRVDEYDRLINGETQRWADYHLQLQDTDCVNGVLESVLEGQEPTEADKVFATIALPLDASGTPITEFDSVRNANVALVSSWHNIFGGESSFDETRAALEAVASDCEGQEGAFAETYNGDPAAFIYTNMLIDPN